MSQLPFELKPNHKAKTKYNWKKLGLNMDNFEEIYYKYIIATHCQLCNKQFTKTIDRQMEHCHATGQFRNIVCNNCNSRKEDRKINSNNTSGYKGIGIRNDKRIKQGYYWEFQVTINGKSKIIKASVDLDKLIKFAEQWKKDNNYYT